MEGYERVRDELERRGLVVSTGWGGSIHARCPAHDDNVASLTLSEGDAGKALLYCHAGCHVKEVADALGLSMSDLFQGSDNGAVAQVYTYTDESGTPLYRVLRRSPKGFYQERWTSSGWERGLEDTRRVIYKLPLVLAGVANHESIWITEGEKDAEAIINLGRIATCPLGGATGKWHEEWSAIFMGATVNICADNDDPGLKRAREIEVALLGTADVVRVLVPTVGKDVSEHLAAGQLLEDMVELDGEGIEALAPLDWQSYEVEETEWLYEPYIPVGGRVLAFGPAGSLKSLWAMWLAGYLTRAGFRVAYFSLEMRPSQTVKRLKQVAINAENFQLFTRFNFNSAEQVLAITKGLRGTDLIVVDSWSAAHGDTNNNDAVARLDNDVFQPIIDATGAALLILDNVGKETFSQTGKVIEQTQARGASAKGDKMEITLSFKRPDEQDNYRTRIRVEKMRLDHAIPRPETWSTPAHEIAFSRFNPETHMDELVDVVTEEASTPDGVGYLGEPVTAAEGEAGDVPQVTTADSGGVALTVADASPSVDTQEEGWTDVDRPTARRPDESPSAPTDQPLVLSDAASLTSFERRQLARVKDKLGAVELTDTSETEEA